MESGILLSNLDAALGAQVREEIFEEWIGDDVCGKHDFIVNGEYGRLKLWQLHGSNELL